MKRAFFFVLFISSISVQAQQGSRTGKSKEVKKLVTTDSVLKKLQQIKDNAATSFQALETKQTQENISTNLDWILQLQKEQKAKQKKAAIIRIAIGIGLLVVLVIGLRRKGKK